MRVKILKRSFAGAEFAPDVRVLKVGGQSSAGVEKLEFELPAEWQGLSVTLHVQWLDGTLPAPVLLDDEDSVAVDKTLTASPGGQWMLLALGADGYRALTRPTKYECYSTLNTDGPTETWKSAPPSTRPLWPGCWNTPTRRSRPQPAQRLTPRRRPPQQPGR